MDRDETGRRIRAARALGVPTEAELAKRKRTQTGLTYDDVAERIGLDGYSAKTIGNMERGDTPALRPALTEIAKACGLPYEFFTADLSDLGPDVHVELTDLIDGQNLVIQYLLELSEREDDAHLTGLATELDRLRERRTGRQRNRP